MELTEKIEELKNKRKEITEYQKFLNDQETRFNVKQSKEREAFLHFNKENWKIIENKEKEYQAFGNELYYVPFKDFVNEVLMLAGDKYGKLSVYMDAIDFFDDKGIHAVDSISELIPSDKKTHLSFGICDETFDKVCIEFDFVEDLHKKMSDGSTLVNNIITVGILAKIGAIPTCINNTYIVNNELVSELLVPISIMSLAIEECSVIDETFIYNTPLDLFSQAAINCINKSKGSKRSRKK